MKTGFKATYNFVCRDHKFEIGQTYELPGNPIPCEYGFHYCQDPINVLGYYPIKHSFRLLEIEDLGESITEGNKSVTNKIRIIREIPKEEYYQLFGVINNELIIIAEDCTYKRTFDENNNIIRFEDSSGYWEKIEYDENNNEIYSERSNGYWLKRTCDTNNNCLKTESGWK
jgi:hypothetical protein